MSQQTRGGWLSTFWAQIRGSLWPIPVIAIVLAIALGIGLPTIDDHLGGVGQRNFDFIFGGGPAAARSVLSSIVTALISVTGLVFSLTVVALQLGSSQYSPRLLQTFVTDRTVQLTLGQLVLTFVYALTVLRTVRTESATQNDAAFVPRLSVTVAYLLTLGAAIALVLFLAHLSSQLRVETMLREVHTEADAAFARELPAADEPLDQDAMRSDELPMSTPLVLSATDSGFLIDIGEAPLVKAARKSDAVILLDTRLGDSVVAGTPVAHVWPRGAATDELDVDALQHALDNGLRLNFERTATRDVGYSLRKVIDIASRALSPGVNDPTTAIHALSHASSMLCDLLSRPLDVRRLHDDDGRLRLVIPNWSAEALVGLALEESLYYGAGQPTVLRRLAELLREVAYCAIPTVKPLVLVWLDRLEAVTEESTSVTDEERAAWRLRAEQAARGQWLPDRPDVLR